MDNKIMFSDLGRGPIQENEVNENQTVKFYCNIDFSLIFGSDFENQYRDDTPEQGLTAPKGNGRQVVFPAEPHGDKYRVKIKFKNVPYTGFKYIVRTTNGDLDPRVVPPR